MISILRLDEGSLMNSKILINNIKQLPSDPRLNNVLEHLCIQMQEKLQGLRKIYIYGSQARGDWDEDSDLDILVIIDKERVNLKGRESIFSKVCEIAADVYLDCENDIPVIKPVCLSKDIWELTEEDLQYQVNPAFIEFIKTDGVIIYDESK